MVGLIRIEDANSIAGRLWGISGPRRTSVLGESGHPVKCSCSVSESHYETRPLPSGVLHVHRRRDCQGSRCDPVRHVPVRRRSRLWLIVATIAEQIGGSSRVSDRNAALKQSMITAGYRPEEIVRVLNAGHGEEVDCSHEQPVSLSALDDEVTRRPRTRRRASGTRTPRSLPRVPRARRVPHQTHLRHGRATRFALCPR